MEFKLFGTKIYISFLFVALVCFLLSVDRSGLFIPLLGAVVLHEGAHLLFMWIFNCPPKDVRLIPASIQIVRGFSVKKNGEIYIAAAGPIANLLVGGVFFIDFLFCHKQYILTVCLINLTVALFNLLPLMGLDGGTILCALINRKSKIPFKGERVIRIITLLFGVLCLFLGVILCCYHRLNLSFFAVALYLIISVLIKQ